MSGFTMAASQPRTIGIDLASQPKNTAACVIEWAAGDSRVVPVADVTGQPESLRDSAILELVQSPSVEKVGIDAPFGWPSEFVDAVVGWRDRQDWHVPPDDPEAEQAKLILRETDREVLQVTGLPLDPESAARRGKRPLSVTTDKIAFTAMRCVRILTELSRIEGAPVDRSGAGKIVEVYPDAALREWGVWPEEWDRERVGYKADTPEARERRGLLMNALIDRAGNWLGRDATYVESCVDLDHELDALISALVARAVAQGNSQPVADKARAEREGWIHLPESRSLEALSR